MIKRVRLTFITDYRFKKRDAEKLRGYFANRFRDEDFFHNHQEDGRSIYRAPLIQYAIIDGQLNVFGYNEAVPLVTDKFLKVDKLVIDDREYDHFETNLIVKNEDFFIDDDLYGYDFKSLWLPVNQKNYLNYINKKLDLNRVLQNHLLTNFKGLNIDADKKIMARGEFKERSVMINNIEYFGFTGHFVSNVKIPDYMTLGQMRAIGFGSVKCEAES